jgi:hypothetical protein
VILRNAATRDAVFSPRQLSTYHANIVERFLWGEGMYASIVATRLRLVRRRARM